MYATALMPHKTRMTQAVSSARGILALDDRDIKAKVTHQFQEYNPSHGHAQNPKLPVVRKRAKIPVLKKPLMLSMNRIVTINMTP